MIPSRRTTLKWLHWLGFFLILYFYLVEPDESRADPGGALSTHAGVGALLAIVVLIWTAIYLRKGLASRPGPKLPQLAKTAHPLMHKILHIAMPVMMLSGLAASLSAPFAIRAFGLVPLNGANGSRGIYKFVEEVHSIAFDVLIVLIIAHVAFHLWRHFWVKDNALRIMMPKVLHRWL